MLTNLTVANFDSEVKNSQVPVLVDFWAEWCGPCRRQTPILEELAKTTNGKIKVCKLNVDEQGEIAKSYGIMSIPTLLLFKNGEIIKKLVGLTALADLQALVE